MGILSWIIFGLLVGALARWIMPGKDPAGCLITAVLGVAGALLGGFLASLVGLGSVTGFDLRSLAIAVAGAMLILWLRRRMAR